MITESIGDFCPEELEMATRTIERFIARTVRLYGQEVGEPIDSLRSGLYVRGWVS